MTRMPVYRYDPDYVFAPGETLQEWMTEMGLAPGELAASRAARGEAREYAVGLIEDVLAHKPMTDAHVKWVATMTGIGEQFWRNLEHNYRVGLAAGKHDASEQL